MRESEVGGGVSLRRRFHCACFDVGGMVVDWERLWETGDEAEVEAEDEAEKPEAIYADYGGGGLEGC